ncbi:hypothetical protein CSUI_009353, partial [Cystoisospora suis]
CLQVYCPLFLSSCLFPSQLLFRNSVRTEEMKARRAEVYLNEARLYDPSCEHATETIVTVHKHLRQSPPAHGEEKENEQRPSTRIAA